MADYKDQGLYQEGNSLFDDIFAFGDLEVQNINVVGIITAKTFSGVDATSLKDNTGTVQIQATTTGATHSGRAVFNEVELQGKVYDSDGDFGSSGQVLSSDGTDIEWVNAGSLSAGSAAQVSVANEASDTTCFLLFATAATGNLQTKSNSNLTFNSSTGALSASSLSGNLTGNVTGTIQTAAQTNITSIGTLTGLNVSGTTNIRDGNVLQFGTATNNNTRGFIGATETPDANLIIATSNNEAIAFKDNGINGTTNMLIRGDGNVFISNGELTVSGNINANGNIIGDNYTSISGIDGITASTLTGSLQTAAQTNITSVGTLSGLTVDGNVLLDTTSKYLSLKGALLDKDGEPGANGEVLVSTGSQVDWQNPNTLTASNSIKITITENDNNTDFPITFSVAAGQSGGNTLHSDNQFTYNALANVVTAGSFSGSGSSLTSLNASNLGTGTVPDARLSNSSLFVQGMIMMYTGSTAPSGWAICDGQNGTPDLRDRFIVGAGSAYSVGNTGGQNSVTLTTAQMPSHKHSTSVDNTTLFPAAGGVTFNYGGAGQYPGTTFTMSNEGGGQSHENRPPYYALMFIVKL